jgi:hypothetical protein
MKIMYVASNPSEASSLRLEQEINVLQGRFSAVSGEPIRFLTFPSLAFEDFPVELSRLRPDVLHISAHGDERTGTLALSNEAGDPVRLAADALLAFLRIDPPRLVYLNACDSEAIAEKMVELVPYAIGTSAPISNRSARAAAVTFYDRILRGATVQDAFDASEQMLASLQGNTARSVLKTQNRTLAQVERLYMSPQLVARFSDEPSDGDDLFTVETGMVGCPGNTSQLVIFTDDNSFIDDDIEDEDDEQELASYLCRVIQGSPVRNVMWSDKPWTVYGDFRICASGITAAGDIFAASSTLCQALETFYQLISPNRITPAKIRDAIVQLRSEDGSGLTPPKSNAPAKPKRKKRRET